MRQRGVYVVLFPFVVIALFGVIGLTLTSGNAFVSRTKLQNMIDAMALSVAVQVNLNNADTSLTDSAAKCSASRIGAEQAMRNVYDYSTYLPGNQLIRDAIDRNEDFVVEYASPLVTGEFSTTCPPTDPSRPIYVRVRVQSGHGMEVPEFMIQAIRPWLGGETYDVKLGGSAVAGPVPVMPMWTARQYPLPAFVCDHSDTPASVCDAGSNSQDCSYGYPKNTPCKLTDLGGGPSICGGFQERLSQSLTIAGGFSWPQSVSEDEGAYPFSPDPDGNVSLTPTLGVTETDFEGALKARLPDDPQDHMSVPVLSCAGGQVDTIRGYLCVEVKADPASDNLELRVVDAATAPALCGASRVIGGPGSLPREPGLMPTFWRIVLQKNAESSDS